MSHYRARVRPPEEPNWLRTKVREGESHSAATDLFTRTDGFIRQERPCRWTGKSGCLINPSREPKALFHHLKLNPATNLDPASLYAALSVNQP